MRLPALALLLAVLALTACAPGDGVPTYTVEARAFRHQVTAQGNLEAAEVTRLSVPTEAQGTVRLAWLAAEGRVEEGEIVARFDPTAMEESLRRGRLDQKSAELKIGKLTVESSSKAGAHETELEIADLELEHARDYQKSDADVFSRHEIIESQIDEKLAEERKDHASRARQTQESLGTTERQILEIEKRRAELDIERAEKGLQALEVAAPHAGILTLVRDWRGEPPQIGAEMWQGQPIAEIPDLSRLEARVFVLEADAGGLEAGRAHAARITTIDTVAQPRFRGSPVQYFGVTLEFEEPAAVPKKPGQRVQATLHLEELDDALVVPRQALFDDSEKTARVYVENGHGFVPRRVEIGARSPGLVVVTAGLEAGERVALAEPVLAESMEARHEFP